MCLDQTSYPEQRRALTVLLRVAAAHGAVGCLLALVGAVTPEWIVIDRSITAGVIFACTESECSAFAAEGLIALTRVFVVVGFFCAVAGLIVSVVYYFKYFRREIVHRALPVISAILYFIAVGLDVAGVVIFAVKGKSDAEESLEAPGTLGYSFTLTVAASVFCGVAGSLSLIHRSGLPGPNMMVMGSEHFQL